MSKKSKSRPAKAKAAKAKQVKAARGQRTARGSLNADVVIIRGVACDRKTRKPL